ncbi:MAG: hypothetical protein CMO72_05400 [Verrucomicrobiales bacterium]|nr:hypothetical protein [Verrucomicrobiales bacterium]
MASPVLEKAIRKQLDKSKGYLTKADLDNITHLDLEYKNPTELPEGLENLTELEHLSLDQNKLTNVKGLEKLTQLKFLSLRNNELTKVQINELQKALPNCRIRSNPTK